VFKCVTLLGKSDFLIKVQVLCEAEFSRTINIVQRILCPGFVIINVHFVFKCVWSNKQNMKSVPHVER
jgi:hypothetical protein